MPTATVPGHLAGLPEVYLKSGADRRLRRGHCWIYSNEIDVRKTPLKLLPQGGMATVKAASGKQLGSAYFNNAALLCGRLYSRTPDTRFEALFERRINAALRWREHCFSQPYYRLIYGDGDGLPGLVVDRYGDYLVLQVTTAGMMACLDSLLASLVEVVCPKGILLRNDAVNEVEALPAATEVVFGEVPERCGLIENGLPFIVPLFKGQKTGWFFDHRNSRIAMQSWVKDCRVLDVYSYIGSWGLQALQAGAAHVHCVDRSELALEFLACNAREQQLESRLQISQGRANDVLKSLVEAGEKYDVVILDPPAFIKRRKDHASGIKAYHQINQLALKLLDEGGLLISASCSLHLSRDELTGIIRGAANKSGKWAQVVYQGGLGVDHPVQAAMPEMNYLKAVFARIISSD